ncbi:MAG: NAD(P)/FAD-dependent oxidoreductase [Oscillospiraceae bacterium]|nr:NAD(P)/FAD-dependent oxidoreductase [Oscillospiraceae bacterium]
MSYEMLLSPMNIGTMTVKNRTIMSAAEVSLGQANGKPTEKLMAYYEERAKGGVGLIIPGITRVNDDCAASTYTQLAMSHDYHIEPMREFAERIHKHGAKLGIQLHHPGRQGYSSSIHSLPMVIPIVDRFPKVLDSIYKCTPILDKLEKKALLWPVQAPYKGELANHGAMRIRQMSRREVKNLINDFIRAAVRCKKAGVDIVELHGGHGYIIQQFLSPNTNKREDEYGGSFENRMRFISEIIDGIRAECGRDYPLMVRLTADEMYEKIGMPGKGYTIETGKRIAKRLEELGVDAINVTSACYDAYSYWLEPTSFEPGWRKYLAKEIKSVVSIPVAGASVIRTPEQAEQQLQEGCQDFVASARTFICDPHWVKKAEEGRSNEIRRCIGCLNCIRSFMTNAWVGKAGECALNMSMGREEEYFNMPQDGEGRHIIVIGAGPAGLTAAHTLLHRGFKVTVIEKDEKPGGQVITASTCHLKGKLYWAIEDLMTNVTKLGGEVKLGCDMTAEQIAEMKPYAVVVATGGTPIRPKSIPGIDLDTVVLAPEIIMGEKKIENKKVVVVGSGITGLEVTEFLNDAGCEVTVIEMAPEVAPGAWFQLVDDEMERIKPFGTKFMTGTKLVGIEPGKVLVEDVKTGAKSALEADNVVLSLGVRPVNDMVTKLVGCGIHKVVTVGDAKKSGTIADATHSAYNTVMKIS